MITGKAYRNGNLHFTLNSEAKMACEEHTADASPIALDEVEASKYWASGCVPRSKSKPVLRRRASRIVAIRIAILDYDKHQHMAVARLRKFSRGNASGYETQ